MRKLWVALGVASVLIPSLAWADAAGCPGVTGALSPMGHEQLTVSTAAVGFASIPASGVKLAVVSIQSQPIRHRDDRTNPTSTVGTFRGSGTEVIVCGASVGSIRFIRDTSATGDATLDIDYYGN